MLSTYATVELLIAGLRNAPALPGHEPILSITEADRFAWAGFHGYDIPDVSDGVKAGDMAIAPGDAGDFALGRWGATGHSDWLDELIRQARHRDGTSHSISVSSYAMEILRVAVETDADFDKLLRSRGYDASSVKFGIFPAGTTAVPVAVPPPGTMHPEAADTSTVDEATAIADGVIPATAAAVVGTAGPALVAIDSETAAKDGAVIFALRGDTYALSITDARGAADSLERAIRSLLLPGEGYRWDDSSDLTTSALVVFDPELVKEFEPYTTLKFDDGPDAEGRFILGRVMIDFDGTFSGRVFTKLLRKERSGDMNDAKFHVAQRVRELLADPAARFSASLETA